MTSIHLQEKKKKKKEAQGTSLTQSGDRLESEETDWHVELNGGIVQDYLLFAERRDGKGHRTVRRPRLELGFTRDRPLRKLGAQSETDGVDHIIMAF